MSKAAKSKEKVEDSVEEKKVTVAEAQEVEFPVIGGNGKFQMVEVIGGYAIYNPGGQRVSGVEDEAKARDIVLRQNNAAHLK